VKSIEVYLGLGSNLGGRIGNLDSAVERLSEKVAIKKISSVYETEPLYNTEQPMFLNAVIKGVTALEPLELLSLMKGIERDLGRQPGFRNAPRIIDIDILFYGERIIQTEELTIPHPRIAERAFVLVPLAEIAPRLVHPQLKKTVKKLLAEVNGKEGVRKIGELKLRRKTDG
jgi:2-amino-4-hydroxy-6-hydroxymethyldihydropteridine diphosphokinase